MLAIPDATQIPKPLALACLLEHGGMTWGALIRCTLWTDDQLRDAVAAAVAAGWVRSRKVGCSGNTVYEALP